MFDFQDKVKYHILMKDEFIMLNLLDQSFMEPIGRMMERYVVGFYKDTASRKIKLIGTGTLVKSNGNYAITTNEHVIEVLKKMEDIGLIVGNFKHRVFLRRKHVSFQTVGYNSELYNEACLGGGPDLALIHLGPKTARLLENDCGKVFYNLDTDTPPRLALHKRKDILRMSGGFLAKHVKHKQTGKLHTTSVVWTGFGGEIRDQHRKYWKPTKQWFDYFWIDAANEKTGYRLGALKKVKFKGLLGVSGGPVFAILLKRNPSGGPPIPIRPLLAGINFTENKRQIGLDGEMKYSEKCHGPKTIQLIRKILGTKT